MTAFSLNSRKPILVSTLLASLLLVASVNAQQGSGYILDIYGDWRLDKTSSQQLSAGQTLRTGDVIRIKSPKRGAYIVVANLSGNIIAAKHCNIPGDCDTPIRLPPSIQPPNSTLSVVLDSVMSLLFGDPDRYSIHRVRGAEELSDSVVLLSNGKVDFRSAFGQVVRGRYYLALGKLNKNKPAPERLIGPIVFDWDPDRPPNISIPNLHPGLYELSLVDRQGESISQGSNTWVLVTGPRHFRKVAASFDEALALTKRWGNNVSIDAVRSLLRAHLDHLVNGSLD